MTVFEFGKQNKDAILLLHGGGLSWWNYREVAKLLEKDYHVILPVLDGHAGSQAPFTTIEDNAARKTPMALPRSIILRFNASAAALSICEGFHFAL